MRRNVQQLADWAARLLRVLQAPLWVEQSALPLQTEMTFMPL
jgi:hypothetical protein